MSQEKKASTEWPEGQSGNPNGRPKKPANASDLRSVRSKLKGLCPKSFKVIEASLETGILDGKEITKEQVNTAKWVVNTHVTVHKAVVAEENGSSSDEENEEVNVEETKNKLSLVMVDK